MTVETRPAELEPADGGATGRRRVGRDIALTTLTQVAVAIGGLLLYRLLAVEKGAEGVASYSLVKQTVVFVSPLVMLGLQTAIPRYVALGVGRPRAVESYLLSAIAITGTTTLALSALALVSPNASASVLFGDADRTNLVFPLVATLAATTAFEVMYGYYRGHSNFVVGNVVCVLAVATLPVVLLAAAGDRPIGTLISLMAAGVVIASALALARPFLRALRRVGAADPVSGGAELLDYGRRRIPGELAAVVLFSISPVLAAHYVSLGEVAYISTGLYVLAMITIAFQPIGMVFLPLLARLCDVDFEAARRYVTVLAMCALHVAVFVSPQLVLFADLAVEVWLGPEFERAGTIITIVVAAAGVHALNVILRSALDAAAVTAYNARNNVIALTVGALAAVVSLGTDLAHPLNCIAWSLVIALFCLGTLTLLSVGRIYRLGPRELALPTALTLGAAVAGLAWLFDATVVRGHASVGYLLLIAGLELVLATAYIGGLIRAGVRWPSELRAVFRRRAGPVES